MTVKHLLEGLQAVCWFSAAPLTMVGLGLQNPTILSFAVLAGCGVIAGLIESKGN